MSWADTVLWSVVVLGVVEVIKLLVRCAFRREYDDLP